MSDHGMSDAPTGFRNFHIFSGSVVLQLFECLTCSAIVNDWHKHRVWHEENA